MFQLVMAQLGWGQSSTPIHNIDLTTPMGRGFMAMMSAMAEDERLRIIKRTHEGRQIARANGVKMGRKPILTPYQIKEARQRIAKGEKTREVAKVFNVSISTISRLADAR
jgi:DNA invertase Pin-like site-specific DNA recombinase